MMDSSSPTVNESLFKSHDWEDFYRGVKASMHPNMPKQRGASITILSLVDANLARDKATHKSMMGILIFMNKA